MKLLKPIVAIVFAFLVFLSSTSFVVGVHYCGGKVKDVQFLELADGCGHNQLPPCHRQLMSNCCKDEVIQHEGQGFENVFTSVDIKNPSFVEVEVPPVLIAFVIPVVDLNPLHFYNYDTPLRSVDRTRIHQVFLI